MAGAQEDGNNNTDLSLRMSRVLDEVGLNETILKMKRKLTAEKLENIILQITDIDNYGYIIGSQAEWTTTRGLNSDLDLMYCVNDINIIQDTSEWKAQKVNLFVLQGGDIPAGYCRLHRLDNPQPATVVTAKGCVNGRDCRAIYTHDDLHERFDFVKRHCYTRHGPAFNTSPPDYNQDLDVVLSFKCESTSRQVESRLKQLKGKRWPTKDMLKTAEESGFFVVPVGHRLSKTRDLEWRVSPSLTERCFMFGMNMTQIKCYVVLKMIKKDLIIQKVGESITSFHLKNALFHCIEQTENQFWTEENLLNCIYTCIGRLLKFVEDKRCPNFLIPGENLFSGRISQDQYRPLQTLLEGFLKSEGRFLFEIRCDDVGSKLHGNVELTKFTVDSTEVIRYEVDATFKLVAGASCLLHGRNLQIPDFTEQISGIIEKVSVLKKHQNKDIKALLTTFLQCLYSTYGCLLASRCLRDGLPISDDARTFLERGLDSDLMSGKLKYATVLYSAGELDEATAVLEELERDYDYEHVQAVCRCGSYRMDLKLPFIQGMSSLAEDAYLQKSKLVAFHVEFNQQEMQCCPYALRFELFRAVGIGDDPQKMVFQGIGSIGLTSVDSVVFLYFLQYMVYRASGNYKLQLRSFTNLYESITREKRRLCHLDTAFNLFGQCCEMEGMFHVALKFYTRSLDHNPRYNAAKWLLPLALYKHFSNKLRL